ncbi:PKD domain-containing protein [Nonomuraea sp. NPDC059023]|uniref:PKD domain-containing protein n=1 Tax=unclassified Nonomuraea TaxID=2593643 RepID=UPI0036B523B6
MRDGGPASTHAYRRPGRFTATVTVTDDENCSTALIFTGTSVRCNGFSRARASQAVRVRPAS